MVNQAGCSDGQSGSDRPANSPRKQSEFITSNTAAMKTTRRSNLRAMVLAPARSLTSAHARKMKTDISPKITAPDSVETPLGTLKFFNGFPDEVTDILSLLHRMAFICDNPICSS